MRAKRRSRDISLISAVKLEPPTEKIGSQEAAKSGFSLYTIDDAARMLRLKRTWLYERTRKNAIPHHRFGKYIRFTEADLEAIIRMASNPELGTSGVALS